MKKKVLVTGGTVFVSRYVAEYYVKKGCAVSVLNRNTRSQPEGATLIEADRHALGDRLRGQYFDIVYDITAYTADDVTALLDALDGYGDYFLLSSSAVYPESLPQPIAEDAPLGENRYWGRYGLDKIEAEKALRARDRRAFILRPPYLYGPYNNVYREAFVFDCAMRDRPFYLPGDGGMPLQFFHVEDLCRFMDILEARQPEQRAYHVGLPQTVTVKEWVELCYQAAGKRPVFRYVPKNIEQRAYFSFYDYAYRLDVSRQEQLLTGQKPLEEGLAGAFRWYAGHEGEVRKKPFLSYIDQHLQDLPLTETDREALYSKHTLKSV